MEDKEKFCYEYPKPAVTADCVVFSYDNDKLEVLLIRRKHNPFAGDWAFPGGFADENETLHAAALRELEEETGMTQVDLHELGSFSKVGRDPRGWVITIAYWVLTSGKKTSVNAGDDAAQARWFSVNDMPNLAFDHSDMFKKAIRRLSVAVKMKLCGDADYFPEFSDAELQNILKILA